MHTVGRGFGGKLPITDEGVEQTPDPVANQRGRMKARLIAVS
jgi:hypothetical protein